MILMMMMIYDINAKYFEIKLCLNICFVSANYLCYYGTKYNVTFLHVNIIQCLGSVNSVKPK